MLGQLPVYRLEVTSGRWERRRLDRGVKLLRRAGVRRVLAPAEFPYWERLKEHGLVPPEPWGLLRRLAPQLALAWLDSRGMRPERAAVALRGARASDPDAGRSGAVSSGGNAGPVRSGRGGARPAAEGGVRCRPGGGPERWEGQRWPSILLPICPEAGRRPSPCIPVPRCRRDL